MISALLAVMLLLVSQSAICDEPEGKTVIDDEIELKFIHPEIGSTSKTEPSAILV